MTPYLLIAMPRLTDPNFHQTVVLVINHNEEGAVGLVINRQTEGSLKDLVIPEIEFHPSLLESPVWYGGPCEPERVWLLRKSDKGIGPVGMALAEGVELSSSLECIQSRGDLILEPEDFRLLIGYAGWVEGQLDQEIQTSAWLTAPVNAQLLFETPPEKMWEKAVRDLGFDPSQLTTETSFKVH